MQDVAEKIELLYPQVEDVLRDSAMARNSDKILTWKIWQKFYGVAGVIGEEMFYELPDVDSITRVRRKIQNDEKKYPPTSWEIAKQRHWLENEWKRALGYWVAEDGQEMLII